MKKLLAMLMAAAMLVSFAACTGNNGDEETTAAPEATTVENVAGDVAGEEETEVITEVVTEIVTNEDGETEVVTEIVTEVVTKEEKTTKKGETTKKAETTKKTETTKKQEAQKTTEAAKEEDPSSWSTAEVLKYYQDATAKVVSQKPGYTKTRQATDNGYKAGAALTVFKGEVFKFLGIGSENKFEEKVAKGTNTNDDQCGDYLKKSTLSTSDVSSAKAVKQGSNYVITINVNSGTSQTEGGKNTKTNAPIDKSGICVGNTDRSGFDHKTAAITYDALDDFASTLTMYEKSSNGKVVATIDAATGEISKLVITWDASAEISKVLGSSASLSASTTVTYTNFGW